MKYREGTKVVCRIAGNSIVNATVTYFDTELAFKIIAIDTKLDKYVLHVPSFYNIKNSWNVNEEHMDKYNFDAYFLDERAISVTEDKIVRVQYQSSGHDGIACTTCKEFMYMAAPNQPDGSFKCWQCRSDLWR